MCFSATASFTAASVIGSTGILALSRARSVRELPLAGVPVLFAAQQAIEGTLWLTLPHPDEATLAAQLATTFAVIALVVWPVYAPLAALLAEDRLRRIGMWVFVLLGLAFAAYSARDIILHPYHVVRAPLSLCYINNSPYPRYAMAFYVPATCGGFLLASDRWMRAFGWTIALGLAVSLAFFVADLVSVWCFFAAAASAFLLPHFLQANRVMVRVPGR